MMKVVRGLAFRSACGKLTVFETMGQRMVLDAGDPCRIWDHGHIYLLWRAR
jgi:hypothetical protein